AGGKSETPFVTAKNMVVPNAFVIDGDTAYVSDSAFGGVFSFSVTGAGGTADEWVQSDLLKADKTQCGGLPIDAGANGIALVNNAFYLTNTTKGTIVKVPREANGKAGTPEVYVAQDCANLKGADGLVSDGANGFYLTANFLNRIIRVAADKSLSVAYAGPELDSPASVALQGTNLYITNASFFAAAGTNKPSLLRVTVPAPLGVRAARAGAPGPCRRGRGARRRGGRPRGLRR
ncbi:MAG TPA: SMP-30/gluconolactonase/LRE family protein, partial [Polyangiaceae bacterium]|nr:SMP-30/gluconolactonase/LRE family protein [Polyangiaceae bacterium]